MKTQGQTPRYRATNLEAILETQGRRKDWLATEAEVSPALIAMLLSGSRMASEGVAGRIAKALGVPLFLAFELHESRDFVQSSSNGKAA